MIDHLPLHQAERIWTLIHSGSDIPGPFLSFRWHKLWYETLGTDWQPFILVVDNRILAPLARKGGTVIFSGGGDISDYQDLIGTNARKAAAWEVILPYLKSLGVFAAQFNNIPADSASVHFFSHTAGNGPIMEDTTPRLSLPHSWEDYLNRLSHDHRHELQREIRKFERENPATSFQEEGNPGQAMQALLSLMEHNPKKRQFLTGPMTAFFHKLASVPISTPLLFFSLREHSSPIAMIAAFRGPRSLLLYNSGFDENRYSGAGFYLNVRSIQWAIGQNIPEYNFLQGRERYKYEMGGKNFLVYRVSLRL